MRHELSDYDAVGARKRVLFTFTAVCCSPDAEPGPWLVGVCSDMEIRPPSMGLSASRRYVSTEAGVYSSLDARSTSRARDLLKRPACGRPTRCEDAAPKSPEARRQFTRTEPSPAGVWGLCDVAPITGRARNERQTGAPRRRADAAARESAPNPVRQIVRLAETAIAREAAARRRGAGSRALSLTVFLSPLSVDRRRGAPSSSSKRSARVQLCWHISYRGGRGGRGLMQRITFVGARPAAGRWPRGAFGPGNGHGGFPGPRGGRRGPFAAGLPF